MVEVTYKRLSEKMNEVSLMGCLLLVIVLMMTKCNARSKLSLWIDEGQVQTITKNVAGSGGGLPLHLYIIHEGTLKYYMNNVDIIGNLPILESDIDTVNLTWEAGDEQYTYWFDNLKSKNKTILYNPLLSIPASGIIPKGPKVFQMSIPCTGKEEGVAHLVLGLRIMDQNNRPINGSPIKLRLRKRCHEFETTNLCKMPCQNNGRCNQIGECECPQGYHGQYCEIDMCNPKCENNGTCISPDMCLCLDGFYGKRCEKGYCVEPCQHGGLCIGTNKCNCKSGFSGKHCENKDKRPKRLAELIKEKRRKETCDRLPQEIKKICVKSKRCKTKQERTSSKCKSKNVSRYRKCKKRQEKLAARCVKQKKKRRKRRKRCQKKQKAFAKKCTHKNKIN
ncbi:wnt inhibitory factor 1-like isoform X2 [Mercenaria mercenaria]|uniref:wnt inhibitory factor 1-like isoform X2 n=1 Tax=Mercenaria mercenaria TaxID=6596 RepID=UPI00234E4C16|nr:wnt inhibitory factor 1-like isoform X2 [Mercenaria mercenaria]